ncbi:MAG: DUF72 domain-containing protein [Pyrinomonadaceae bacterium]|nr:DUF72 domain-containing protein [Acidobacteriota bacterium]MBK7933981.1 DUF72 domain-containing protein [Acidobacteriota bacterium]MBP7375509.1 DUF72 domain-containing protein [Pyrinomonadaceae bacterium]
MEQNIKIGTCGFGRSKRPEYVASLPVVEIQHTFYDPPQIKTLEKWRAEVPDDFEFTLKAWQMITHESSSPTYRRLKRPLTEKETEEAGFFKPTDTVREALELTIECAKALRARTILFQCPAKFQPLPENILNLKQFFSNIDRGGLNFAWEPRGKLWEDDVIKEVCDEASLWHCVDPFSRQTVTPDRCYYRLHGIPRWRYTYEDDELMELVSLLPKKRLSYVFFNNITMKEDAGRFQRMLHEVRD